MVSKEWSPRIHASSPRRLSSPRRYTTKDFDRPTLKVCRSLMGQRLVHLDSAGQRLSGMIVEAEAYIGREDLACHARAGRTPRNEVMWGPPGCAYVYFTYGMHWMLNLVAEKDGFPAAVLLRAILPVEGEPIMRKRRITWRRERGAQGREPWEVSDQQIASMANGPAKLCQALAIDGGWNGHDLCVPDAQLFVEKRPPVASVTTGPRVGLNSVPEPWFSKPWRFRVDRSVYPELLSQEEIV